MALIGIDVSKAKLDVAWLRDQETHKVKTRVFSNNPAGIDSLLTWWVEQTQVPIEDLQIMLEATGIYHEALICAAFKAGAQVVVTHPAQAKRFASSLGRRSKTDRKDSVMLALFLASRQHHPWQPEPEEIRHLRALLSRLEALDKDSRHEHNRLEKAQIQNAAKEVLTSIHTVLETLTRERKRLAKEINDHIDRHDSLRQDRALLETIPGIGAVLSVELLAMLRSRDFTSAGQSAAFVGLVPVTHRSGSSVDRPARLK